MGRLHLKEKPTDPDQPNWWTTDEWSTPPEIIAGIEAKYGPIDLDPCCRPETAKGKYFFTKEDDGLLGEWFGFVFVNPPYSKPRPWIEKALAEVQRDPTIRVLLLLPADISTGWFHDLVLPYADIEFVRGRIRFHTWRGIPGGMPTAGSIFAYLPKGWR